MNKLHTFTIIGLGILLILVGLMLLNAIKIFGIITIVIGAIAVFKGIMIQKYYTSKENMKSLSKSEQCVNIVTEKTSSGEEMHILGIKVKHSVPTKIIKKVEPSVERLKSMVFWPFVPNTEIIEGQATPKSKEFKYCKFCGAKISRTSKFCSECGK